jgi:hypothetical protein
MDREEYFSWAIATGEGGFAGVGFFDPQGKRRVSWNSFWTMTFDTQEEAEAHLPRVRDALGLGFPSAHVVPVRISITEIPTSEVEKMREKTRAGMAEIERRKKAGLLKELELGNKGD